MVSAAFFAPASFMSAMTTWQPSLAKRSQMEWPRPWAPPVTMAIRSWSAGVIGILLVELGLESILRLDIPTPVACSHVFHFRERSQFHAFGERIHDDLTGHEVLLHGTDSVDRAIESGHGGDG